MAKARGTDTPRGRGTGTSRGGGLGLMQVALLGGLGAVALSFVGVFLATSTADTGATAHADSLGAGLVALLTAPDAEWWATDHDLWTEKLKDVKKPYPAGTEFPKLEKAAADKIYGDDHKQRTRNKERLQRLQDSLGVGLQRGTLIGLQIRFSAAGYADQTVGARINPAEVRVLGQVGGGINVGSTVAAAAGGSGSYAARVYHREYKDRSGTRVGDVYAILSQAALDSSGGGGGLWLFLTPLLVGLAVLLIVAAASKAASGLATLSRDLETIGRGKLDARVSVTGGGEVGHAQRAAERMAKNLQLIQTTGAGDLDEALEKELDLAGQIHQSLRPSDPPRLPGFELETLFKAGRDIGGDYFDYVELDGNRTAIILADCSESLRGVPAAMVMAMTRAYLKSAINPAEPPTEWLKAVNRRLSRDLKSGMAVTALVLIVDLAAGEVTAVSAGHRPIIMWRQGKTATINPNGIALGLDIGPVFDKTIEEKRIPMQKNDRLVIYTDGVISAQNDKGESYGDARLMESVRRQGAMNSAAFVNFVAGGVDQFLSGIEQNDDITVSTLKRMK